LCRKKPLHAIRSDAVVAVADMPGESDEISRRVHAVDNQEIITAGAGLHKWNDGHVHSSGRGSTGENAGASTLRSTGVLARTCCDNFARILTPCEAGATARHAPGINAADYSSQSCR
jgi:hypothetical protein